MAKMNDSEAYETLRKNKIPIAGFVLARNVSVAEEFAEKTGYPIFLKVDADIVHKAKLGCVKKACDKKALQRAYDEIMANAKKVTSSINGVIVQEQIEGMEVIVGAKRDSQFGTVIIFGTGGVFTNIIKDVAFRVEPLEKEDITSMIEETKAFAVFEELQSKKVLEQLSSIIQRVSVIMDEDPNLKEIDINPVFVSKERVVAADVRFIL